MDISSIFKLLCGVSLFLYGMSLMGDSLKKVGGNKLETILYRLTNTPAKGILLGLIVTAIIQSSSATTVMVVGFVNSGRVKQAGFCACHISTVPAALPRCFRRQQYRQ